MFYTYLRGLVAFILWVLNGMPITIIRTIFQIGKNLHLVSPHRTCGSGLYGLAAKPKAVYLYGEKELSSPPYFWLVDSHAAWSTVKTSRSHWHPVNMLKKSNRSWLCFQVEAVILKTCIKQAHVKNGEGPYHASDLYWSKRLERVGNVRTHWYELDIPLIFRILKKMNDEGSGRSCPVVSKRGSFNRLDA